MSKKYIRTRKRPRKISYKASRTIAFTHSEAAQVVNAAVELQRKKEFADNSGKEFKAELDAWAEKIYLKHPAMRERMNGQV